MRKKSAILFGFLLATLISMSTISMVQADIESHWWVDPEYEGYDYLKFHTDIVAYVTGTTAKLSVLFSNNYGFDVNVSSVRVWFDWGETYNSTECSAANPVEIKEDEAHTFTISFTVPSTTIASNLVLHDYRITVEYDGWTTNQWGSGFAVLSATQADAFEAFNQLYPLVMVGLNFTTAKAKVLWAKAIREMYTGLSEYQSGRFSGANATFYTTLDLVDQAFDAEEERGSGLEGAMMNYYNAATIEAYAWLLFGLGIVLIGIGAIIYARQPRVPKAPKAA